MADAYRSLNSFGVAGVLSKKATVYYSSDFRSRHLGRVSDLLAAKLKEFGPDELKIRSVLLYGVFDSYLVQNPNLEPDQRIPAMIECGVDEEWIAVSVGFLWDENYDPRPEGYPERIKTEQGLSPFDSLLRSIVQSSTRLIVRRQSSGKKLELTILIHRTNASLKLEPLLVDVDGTAADVPVAEYTEIGDLDFKELLHEKSRAPDSSLDEETRSDNVIPLNTGFDGESVSGSSGDPELDAVLNSELDNALDSALEELDLDAGEEITQVVGGTSDAMNEDSIDIPGFDTELEDSVTVGGGFEEVVEEIHIAPTLSEEDVQKIRDMGILSEEEITKVRGAATDLKSDIQKVRGAPVLQEDEIQKIRGSGAFSEDEIVKIQQARATANEEVRKIQGSEVLTPEEVVKLKSSGSFDPSEIQRIKGGEALQPEDIQKIRGTGVLPEEAITRIQGQKAEAELAVQKIWSMPILSGEQADKLRSSGTMSEEQITGIQNRLSSAEAEVARLRSEKLSVDRELEKLRNSNAFTEEELSRIKSRRVNGVEQAVRETAISRPKTTRIKGSANVQADEIIKIAGGDSETMDDEEFLIAGEAHQPKSTRTIKKKPVAAKRHLRAVEAESEVEEVIEETQEEELVEGSEAGPSVTKKPTRRTVFKKKAATEAAGESAEEEIDEGPDSSAEIDAIEAEFVQNAAPKKKNKLSSFFGIGKPKKASKAGNAEEAEESDSAEENPGEEKILVEGEAPEKIVTTVVEQPEKLIEQIEAITIRESTEKVEEIAREIQSDVGEEKSKRWLATLKSEYLQEKIKLKELSQALNHQFKQKELDFSTKERTMTLELRRRDEQLRQKNTLISRKNDHVAQLNLALEKSKTSGSVHEDPQVKMKLNQAQKIAQAKEEENRQLLQRLRESENKLMLAQAKTRSAPEAQQIQTKLTVAEGKIEELRKLNQKLSEASAQPKDRPNDREAGDLRRKLEISERTLTESKKLAEKNTAKMREHQEGERKLRIEVGRMQEELKKLKSAATRGGGGKAA